jgi:hypothetical protein
VSDDEYPPEAGDNVVFLDMHKPTGRKRKGGGGSGRGGGGEGGDPPAKKEKRRIIPVLPKIEIDASEIEITGPVTRRDRAVVNMRITGASFQKISDVLDLGSATEAKKILYATLAKTHPEEDWDTLRQLEIARADQLLEQAMSMAGADYFVDHEDPDILIPNEDKIRWAGVAQSALALHATITGAKAPVRMEVTPTDHEYAILVQKMLELEGKAPPKEYDILDAEEVTDEESGPE